VDEGFNHFEFIQDVCTGDFLGFIAEKEDVDRMAFSTGH